MSRCKNCFSNKFIEIDGYIICSDCGCVLMDLTADSSIEPVGFLTSNEWINIKKLLKENPSLTIEEVKSEIGLLNYLK